MRSPAALKKKQEKGIIKVFKSSLACVSMDVRSQYKCECQKKKEDEKGPEGRKF